MKLFKKSKIPETAGETNTVPYVIEIERLLRDIEPDAPSGAEDLSRHIDYANLETEIKGTPEKEVGGKVVQDAKPPNWSKIQESAVDLLTRAHDLRIAIFLTRAMLNTHGLAGLYTGLELIGSLVERYWDSLYPQLDPLDDFDPIERINALWTLSEGDEIIAPLMRIRLFSPQPSFQISLRNIHVALGKISPKAEDEHALGSIAEIEKAFKDCRPEALFATRDLIGQTMASVQRLEHLMTAHVDGSQAPDYKGLKDILMEMAAFFDKHLPERTPSQAPQSGQRQAAAPSTEAGRNESARPVDNRTDRSMDTIANRKDVIHVLDQLCAYYEQNEPSSPVPLLLKRARQLVEKNFSEIIQELAPQAADQIKSLLGTPTDSG